MVTACAASISVSAETGKNASDLTFGPSAVSQFTTPNSTKVSVVEDDTEAGYSVKLELTAPFTDPYVYFNYRAYIRALGLLSSAPKADDVKYIVFKVKPEFCSNNVFEIFYCSNKGVASPTGGYSVVSSYDEGDESWQYAIFDLSKAAKWSGDIYGFRIDWMLNGTGEGETLYINEIIFAQTAEEIEKYKKTADENGVDLHALLPAEQYKAEYLLDNAKELAPEVSNDKLTAEYEDESLVMWFDHSYYKTPGETVTSNGQNTYQMRLAKNEIETAQMVLASASAKEDLTVEVSDFVNGEARLTPRIYYGYYFDDVEGKSIVDPIPLLDSPISLEANKSQMFLIKIKTEKDSPAGQYTATLTVKDKDGKEIKKANLYAYVWDFALPDASNVKTLADLGWFSIYAMDNINGTLYGDDTGCKCGDDSSPYHAHSGLTYKNYYDMLLENKINAYGMPYVNEAEYGNGNDFEVSVITSYLDDPRVQAFNPIGYSKAPSTSNITRAYNFLSQKKEWMEKAYFYTVDEPMGKDKLDQVRNDATLIKSVWGDDYKLITPMHLNGVYDKEYKVDAFEYVKGYTNVWCPHTFFFNTYADKQANPALTYRCSKKVEENIGTFPERMAQAQENGEEVWWYVTRYPHYPEITLSISDPAVDHRIFFWQQKLYNVDGFLYYAVNDWFQNASEGWGWDKKKEVSTDSYTPYTVYGNGVLVYHGGKIGKIHEPVESIRLEQIRDGIEDYDYLTLLDEKFGEGTSDLIIKQITTSLGNFKSDIELFTALRLAVGNLLAGDKFDIPEPPVGDVNGDGETDNKDVTTLFRYISGDTIDKIDIAAADCTGDGKTNNKDVTILFRYLGGYTVDIFYGRTSNEQAKQVDTTVKTELTFDKISVMIPDNYYTSNPGLLTVYKKGVSESEFLFNFSKAAHAEPITEEGADAFVGTLVPSGPYTVLSYKKYLVGGAEVVKIDYTWNSDLITQSYVRVYLDKTDDVIMFGSLYTVAEGPDEFEEVIKTLKVNK